MKLLKKSLFTISSFSLFFLTPFLLKAANDPGVDCPEGKICNPIKSETIQAFIQQILEGVLRIGIPLIALAIIYCGFLFVKAQGNEKELQEAKDAFFYTLIGSAILLGAWALAKLIAETVLALD